MFYALIGYIQICLLPVHSLLLTGLLPSSMFFVTFFLPPTSWVRTFLQNRSTADQRLTILLCYAVLCRATFIPRLASASRLGLPFFPALFSIYTSHVVFLLCPSCEQSLFRLSFSSCLSPHPFSSFHSDFLFGALQFSIILGTDK